MNPSHPPRDDRLVCPTVILISEQPTVQAVVAAHLPSEWRLMEIASMAGADTSLRQLLTHSHGHPHVILIDEHLTWNGQSTYVDGWAFLALVMQWMLTGEVAPTLVIGVGVTMTDEQRDWMLAAGAWEVLDLAHIPNRLPTLLATAWDPTRVVQHLALHRATGVCQADNPQSHYRRVIQALGVRLYTGLKSVMPSIRETDTPIPITPDHVEILLDYRWSVERPQLVRDLGGEAYVLPRLEAALDHVRSNDRRPYTATLIRYLQRNVKKQKMAEYLSISRVSCYRAVLRLYHDVAEYYNQG